MEKMDYWRLCDALTVVQAALLIVGADPGEHPDIINSQEETRPINFSTTLKALSHAILEGRLPAIIRREAWERGWAETPLWKRLRDEEPGDGENFTKDVEIFSDQKEIPKEAKTLKRRGIIYRTTPDWNLTTVLVEDLQGWLKGRGFNTGFFFPHANIQTDFLDPHHKNYSPKLAAAIESWRAISADPGLTKGKTVKQALKSWLRQNAGQFGLTKDDGNPNEQGITEIAIPEKIF